MTKLIERAAFIWGTTPEQITGSGRSRAQVMPRHAVCIVARQTLGLSLQAIGSALGGRDHTTIRYALDAAAGLIAYSAEYRELVERLRMTAETDEGPAPIPRINADEAAGIGRLAMRLRELARYEPARFNCIKAAILQ